MINKFQDKAQRMIALAESIAFDLGQSSVGTEHLLLAFCKSKDNKLKNLLEKEGITYDTLKADIISLFGKKSNKPFFMEYTNFFFFFLIIIYPPPFLIDNQRVICY